MYKFQPLLKQTIWGGDSIIPFKHLSQQLDHVGESWELSGVPGSETVVSEGPCAGMTLNELVRSQREHLLGHDNYARFGDEFPLLVKFIDAHKDLSIQVHPNDEVAHRHGHPRGKTEMWYVMASPSTLHHQPSTIHHQPSTITPHLYCGLKQQITPEQYAQMVAAGTITEALARYDVSEGDVFFIPAGRIHAIGAGSFVAEIQQTSDVTYRIYDYNRRDANGNLCQLHTREAAEAIDYNVQDDYRTHYQPAPNMPQPLVSCPYFNTAVYDLTEPMLLDYADLDSFVILIGLRGEAKLTVTDASLPSSGVNPSSSVATTTLRAGETLLLPATTQTVMVEGQLKMLGTYI